MQEPRAERELADYLRLLWSKCVFIVAGTAAAVGVALAVSFVLPEMYRAAATLMIAESKVPTTDAGEPPQTNRSQLYAETYAELLRSRSITAGVIRDLRLDQEPYRLTAERLAAVFDIDTIPSTLLLRVSLDFPDPELGARIINEQVDRAVALSKSLMTSDLTETREYLDQQVAAAKAALEAAEEELTAYQRTARYQETGKRLEGVLQQLGELEAAGIRTEQEVAQLTAAVASLRASLEGQDQIVTLMRSLENDGALKDVVEAQAEVRPESLLALQMRSQEVNPIYAASEPLHVRLSSDLAGAIARRDAIDRQLKDLTAEAVRLQQELAEKGRALNARVRESGLAGTAYESFARRYESARLSVAAQAAELKVVDAAVGGTRPISPRPLVNAVVAAVVGFIGSLFLVLLVDYLQNAAAPALSAASEDGEWLEHRSPRPESGVAIDSSLGRSAAVIGAGDRSPHR